MKKAAASAAFSGQELFLTLYYQNTKFSQKSGQLF